MALSTSMAAGAGPGGAAMTVNPGVSFGANAMAAPQTFSRYEPPPNSAPQQTDPGTGGSRGAGGAYDLRAWAKEDLPEEDDHACLGMDVGTSSIKVRGEYYYRLTLRSPVTVRITSHTPPLPNAM